MVAREADEITQDVVRNPGLEIQSRDRAREIFGNQEGMSSCWMYTDVRQRQTKVQSRYLSWQKFSSSEYLFHITSQYFTESHSPLPYQLKFLYRP